ncbi:hypothetical protein [Symbiobacterium terraclitae]|uniref:hypothetical protein n=1 Tax=Symbiobacterium terraclitae TaxID=557451 RepID=UPI0035B54BF2
MLKNRFRQLIGLLVVGLFAVAVVQFLRQTAGSPHLGSAVASGLGLLFFLAAVLAVAWWAARRARARGE